MTLRSTTGKRADATPTPFRASEPQTLLIDADDTLWENNIYFERAIARFISFLNHREFTPEQVRERLNEVERDNILRHGYGLHSFTRALVNTFEQLTVDPITPELHRHIQAIAQEIAEHPVQLIVGVVETLEYLVSRGHHLIVVTKGDVTEQSGKLDRSGLATYFAAVEIVAEKNVAAYREIMEKYDVVPQRTWMIGNSPKSDVNPALGAGLNAVFVPHDNTWILEHEEVKTTGHGSILLELPSFGDLQKHF